MPANYSLSIVHPSLELLKRHSRFLHFIAATLISINAVHQLSAHEGSSLICYTQLIIALDIFILVFFGAGILSASARPGVIFRCIEALTFMGIAFTLKVEHHPWLGAVHGLAALLYGFLCYREWRISASDSILLNNSGIVVPNLFAHAEIKWLHIKKVVTGYNRITIETVSDRLVQFELRHNLKIEELEQINDFCVFHARLSG